MADIIIVEDDRDLGPLLVASLEDSGHAVRLYTSGPPALEAFRDQPCDVMIVDMLILNATRSLDDGGITVIWRMRELVKSFGKPVGIIAISGATSNFGMDHLLRTAKSIGADISLEKPFSPTDLLDAIEDVIAQKASS